MTVTKRRMVMMYGLVWRTNFSHTDNNAAKVDSMASQRGTCWCCREGVSTTHVSGSKS